MTIYWTFYFCLFLGLWSALVGGVFKAFSEFLMSGLLRADPAGGIESMQQINRTVIRTEFVFALILIAPVSLAFAVYALIAMDGPGSYLIIAAAAIYLPFVFLMTIVGNVPMNNRLDQFDHLSGEAETYWREYGVRWTRLNHFRTLGSIVTAILYLLAAASLAGF